MPVSSRIDGSAPTMGKTPMSVSRSDIPTDLPVASHTGSSSEMIHGLAWTAGKDNASGAELGRAIGNEGHFLLMRDQEDRSAGFLQRADDVDDVIDREHIDARRRLIEDRQLGFHREDGRKLDPVALPAAQRLVQ